MHRVEILSTVGQDPDVALAMGGVVRSEVSVPEGIVFRTASGCDAEGAPVDTDGEGPDCGSSACVKVGLGPDMTYVQDSKEDDDPGRATLAFDNSTWQAAMDYARRGGFGRS